MSSMKHFIHLKSALAALKISLPVCLLLLCFGCTSPGEQLDKSAVTQVKTGMDRKDVIKLLGEPKSTERGPEQMSLDDYMVDFDQPRFMNSSVANGEWLIKSMQVIYDGKMKVHDFYSYEGKLPYRQLANGNLQAGKADAESRLPKIQKSKDHFYDLVEWFGEPTVTRIDLDGRAHYHWIFFQRNRKQTMIKYQQLEVILDNDRFVSDFIITEPK